MAHVGASYYLSHTGEKPLKIDQNQDEYRVVTLCASAYMEIVAPNSTLAASSAFSGETGLLIRMLNVGHSQTPSRIGYPLV